MSNFISLLCVLFFFQLNTGYSSPLFFKGYSTCKKPGMIALTFDDGVTKNYPLVLNVLATYNIKATFFVIGATLKNPYNLLLLKQTHDRGHVIGNHTWDHKALTALTDKQIETEVLNTQNGINLITSRSNLYFRPPFGKINQLVYDRLIGMGYTVVLWNSDIDDWNIRIHRDKLWAFYQKHISEADPTKQSFIILQHDRRLDSIQILPGIIELGKAKGFKFVTMDECLGLN